MENKKENRKKIEKNARGPGTGSTHLDPLRASPIPPRALTYAWGPTRRSLRGHA
jgi:hypothetical protein